MTLSLSDRIGNNAHAVASRLHAAANAAVHSVGFAPGTGNTDRKHPQTALRTDEAASSARVGGKQRMCAKTGSGRRTITFVGVRAWALLPRCWHRPTEVDRSLRRKGGATYPSLVSDLDIFLPGEEIVLADVSRRLDIRV